MHGYRSYAVNVAGLDLQKKYKEETETENWIQKYDTEIGEKQVDINLTFTDVDAVSFSDVFANTVQTFGVSMIKISSTQLNKSDSKDIVIKKSNKCCSLFINYS